jgi:hypothetical protein
MVELSTRKREIRGDGGNHHEKLGLERISCTSPFTISDAAGTSPNLAGPIITPIQGLLNQIRQVIPLISQVRSYAPYRSHLDPPSISFSSTTLPSLQQHKVKSSLSISPCHYHELTPSAAYTECSIHRVQHTPMIACRHFILSILSWPLNVSSACGIPSYRSTATSQFSIRASKVKSPHHIPTVLS